MIRLDYISFPLIDNLPPTRAFPPSRKSSRPAGAQSRLGRSQATETKFTGKNKANQQDILIFET